MERPPWKGSENREPISPLEQTQEKLRQLTEAYNNFATSLNELLFSDEKGAKLVKKIRAGIIDSTQIDEIGVKGEQARVFFGNWSPHGNAEGSLYTKFDEDILRVRWLGDNAIYLNGIENYVAVNPDKKTEGRYTLQPKRIEGESILGMNDQGVETERHQQPNNVLRFTRNPEERRLPEEPKTRITPHEEFQEMIKKIQDGLQRTIATLKEAKEIDQ